MNTSLGTELLSFFTKAGRDGNDLRESSKLFQYEIPRWTTLFLDIDVLLNWTNKFPLALLRV